MERMTEIAGLFPRAGEPLLLGRALRFERARLRKGRAHIRNHAGKPAKSIDQLAMRCGIDERALIMLPMNLDERLSDRPKGLGGHALAVHIGPAAAIRKLLAAQDQRAAGFNALGLRLKGRGMIVCDLENRADMTLRRPMADEPPIAPRAERERQAVKQDGFACARLPRQNGQAPLEREIELVDQDNVADGQLNEHRAWALPSRPPLARQTSPSRIVTQGCGRSMRDHAKAQRDSSAPFFPVQTISQGRAS